MRNYKVTGLLAHQSRPKKKVDTTRTVRAKDIVDVWIKYRRKLRGVKKRGLLEIREVKRRRRL